jgi:transcriptional regulator with XRE-family HTH domain
LNGSLSLKDIDILIQLLKQGDYPSLAELRRALGASREELSSQLGMSQSTVRKWEEGKEQPTSHCYVAWKLKLSEFVAEKISTYLNTKDTEVIHYFWEIMWKLNE